MSDPTVSMTILPAVKELEAARRRWRDWASVVCDPLGRGLDDLVVEIVIALNLAGFKTTGSCEGHPDRCWWWFVDLEWKESHPRVLRPMLAGLKEDTGLAVRGERLTAEVLRLTPEDAPTVGEWLDQKPPASVDRLLGWQLQLPAIAKWWADRPAVPAPIPPELLTWPRRS